LTSCYYYEVVIMKLLLKVECIYIARFL